jgi:hypothetical protein
MDVLIEQLYKRKKTSLDIAVQALIFLSTIILAMGFYFIASLLPFGSFVGMLGIIGLVYLGYKLFMKYDLEYEYIYLNGEIDIDKIIAKSDRKRIITVKCTDFEKFGIYDANDSQIKNIQVDKSFNFSSNTGAKQYYAVLKHREFKKTLIIFEPEERIIADMKNYMRNLI